MRSCGMRRRCPQAEAPSPAASRRARALWLWSPDVTDLGAIIIRYRTAPFDDGRAVTIASLPGALALAAYITRGLAVPPGARGLVLENASDDNVPVTIAWGLVP